jgi:hypothetical protein
LQEKIGDAGHVVIRNFLSRETLRPAVDGLEILARLLGRWVTPDLDDAGATSPLPTEYSLMTDLAETAIEQNDCKSLQF